MQELIQVDLMELAHVQNMIQIQQDIRVLDLMARKSALEKIEYHEKICRLMQKQTFEQIQQLKNQIIRIERILIGTAAFVIISLLEKII
jgi:glycerol-3-phosphate cytidylyltransferase-like family protein